MDKLTISLLASVSDTQEDLIVVFEGTQMVFSNQSFNTFFKVKSLKDYHENYGKFVNNFVPHPNYFHKDKITGNVHWIDAMLDLQDEQRIVSMLSHTYEPQAFSVKIDRSTQDYSVVVFKNITQDLIKRIMTQNNTNIDQKSGAFSKKYFLQVVKSYQDAAIFNEKIVAMISIHFTHETTVLLQEFVKDFLNNIRHDDMLIRWNETTFLLSYLAEDGQNAQKVLDKLEEIFEDEPMKKYQCQLKLCIQNENEDIQTLLKRV